MHCSIINSLFTMPFYNNESGIIFFKFYILACFSGEVIHHSLFYYLKDDGNRRFFNDNKTYSYVI
ncbi:Uncharacterised protein [Escherichia coli]|nr:Uncharacterised protein [Escherichia coli]